MANRSHFLTDDDLGTRPKAEEISPRVVEIVQKLARGAGSPTGPSLHMRTRLTEDLGFDSLTRLELLRRLEQEFGKGLASRSVLEVGDIAALVEVLLQAPQAKARVRGPFSSAALAQAEIELPAEDSSVFAEFLKRVSKSPSALHVRLLAAQQEDDVSYAQLAARAFRMAQLLEARGIKSGDRVALMLPTGVDFLAGFLGILRIGAVPVPLYPPSSLERLEDHLRRQQAILKNAGARALLLAEEMRALKSLIFSFLGKSSVLQNLHIVYPSEAEAFNGALAEQEKRPAYSAKSDELAMLQYTSGSTGVPKGVMLTHANLLANIRALAEVCDLRAADRCVSWLPLYHDMGLIGAWLGCLLCGVPMFLMSPLEFLARPLVWFEAISRFGATLSAGPNFAYELCAERIDRRDLEGIDLSRWRLALNGAEPVSAATIERFSEKFSVAGFSRNAMRPVYGLAEATLGVLFPRGENPPRIGEFDRAALEQGRILKAPELGSTSVRLVSCGSPLPRHDVRIVDALGRALPEGCVGVLEFRGPSSSPGYYEYPEATRELIRGEWRSSGDYAARVGEDFFIVGRKKDLIIKGGRNIAPQDVEEVVSAIAAIRRGCVVAFGVLDRQGSEEEKTEQLVVVAETRVSREDEKAELARRIRTEVAAQLEVAPDLVLLVSPRTIPKTSSGKLRRSDCKARYLAGTLERPTLSWHLRLRLLLPALRMRLRSALALSAHVFWGIWAWSVLLVLGAPVFALGFVLPQRLLKRFLRSAVRGFLLLVGVSVRVSGVGHLRLPPETSGAGLLYVSNHQSYLDALILISVLPGEVCFVSKRDFVAARLMELLLARFGTLFVERSHAESGQEDLKEIVRKLKAGGQVAYFPEGTFWSDCELLPFKMGAFVAAAESAAVLVPIAICGSSKVLPDGHWFIKRGLVRVVVSAPRSASAAKWESIREARDETQRCIQDMLRGV